MNDGIRDITPWAGSRRWTPEARAAARERMLRVRPWLLSQHEPGDAFARATVDELAAALARFLPPAAEPVPFLRGRAFAFVMPRR